MEHMQRLNTVSFSNMQNWSILSHLTVANYQSKHKYIKIGSFLKRIKEAVVIQDDVYYKRATIKINNGGVFLRDTVLGKNIGTKNQFIIKKGQLLLSKIDARNGAFGIVPEELDNGVITGNFWTYEIDTTKILPQILSNILSSKRFQEIWEACSNGTTNRHYLQEADFLNTSIPVPSLPEQKEIVENYYTMIRQANDIIELSWTKMDEYYISVLQAKNYRYNPLLQYTFGFVNFKKLTRWDSWATDTGLTSDKYDIVPFGQLVLGKPQYGANVKGVDVPCEYRYIRITDINEDGSLNNEIKYPQTAEKEYILHENDFLIARSGNTVGKTFLYRNEVGPAIFAGYLVRYILNTDLVLPEYLLYYTKTDIFKNWVLKNQRIAGQPNINGQEYLSFPVLLPPIEKQKEIVDKAKEIANQIKKEQYESCCMFEQAKQDFENAIFGE